MNVSPKSGQLEILIENQNMEIKRENDIDNNINPWNSYGDQEIEKNGNFIPEHNIFGNDASIVIKKEEVDDMNMYEEIGHIDIKKETDHQNAIPPSYGNFEKVLIVERPGEYKSEIDIEENSLVPVKDEPESDHETPQDGGTEDEDTEDEGTSQAEVIADGNFAGISKENIHRKHDLQTGIHTCLICDKQLSCRSNLNRHMLIHTGRKRKREKAYECDVCNKKFFEKRRCEVHMRTHTGECPYSCDVCHKKFKDKRILDIHVRLHTGERPYICDICQKTFNQRGSLVSHMRVHTGEKPYECEVCNKKFSVKSILRVHMQIHTGEKPYACEICEKRFSRKPLLATHVRLIHCDKRPYECVLCKAAFISKLNLIRHKYNVHSVEVP